MKKKLLLFGAFLMVSAFAYFIQAQTDVTSTYLTNAGFETAPVMYTENNGAANGTDIPGWTKETAGGYPRVLTASYGITFAAIPDVMNGVNPPSSDIDSKTEGSLLMMSGSWGSTVVLTQDVTLEEGKYQLVFDVLNQNGTQAIATNRFGFVPNAGSAIYGTKTVFNAAWTVETVSFTLSTTTAGKISLGLVGPNAGAASNGKLAIDNVKLIYFGLDKSALESKIAEAQTLYGDGSGAEAADLLAAINAAQAVVDNVNATQANINQAISALDTAIFNYRLANASAANPLNVTNLLINPSFENSNRFDGWTNPGAFAAATSNPATLGFTKNGTVFIEKYIAPAAPPAGTLGDFNVYQTVTVPPGVYRLTASAMARIFENGSSFGTPAYIEGAIVYANGKETVASDGKDYIVDNVMAATGSLTVGFKTIAGMANWVAADNFRIEYIGFDLTEIAAALQIEVDKAELIDGKMQNTVKTELAAAIAAAKAAIATPTKAALVAAGPRLAAAVAAANSSIAAYAALNVVLEEAKAILPSSAKGVNGFAEFSAAVSAANTVYTAATANVDFVNAATKALKEAILTFQVANAAETNPVDVTGWIANPSFEELQGDRQQTIPGWTKTGNSNSEYCTRNDAGPAGFKTGNVYFQYWNNANPRPDYSISQVISLPNGKYTLKADAGSGGTGLFVYANAEQVQVVTGTKEYSVDVVVTDGKLTIGLKSVSRNFDWSYVDNFHLYYFGGDVADDPATTPETTFVPGKSYYLYNAGADKFLAFGGNWATQAVVSQRGAPVTFTEVTEGSGTYYLQYTNADPNGRDIGTKSYLRTSDLFSDQFTIAATVGIFTVTKAEGDSYFTLLSKDVNADGKFLAANTATHNSTNGRWGVATGTPAYGLNMAVAESDYTQWYFYDVELYDARYDLSKLLKIAGDISLANLDEYIADYNAAETVAAVKDIIDALRVDIADAVTAPVDFTSYVDDAGIMDGITPVSIAKWAAIQPANANRRHIPGQFAAISNEIVTAGSFEYFNTNFNFKQTLNGLPQGVYQLKAQAFERAKANDSGEAYKAGTEVIQSKIYASSNVSEFTAPVKSLYEQAYESSMGGSQTNGYINNMEAAQNAFLKGYYEVELGGIIVGEDGVLTIGIKKGENLANSWTLFDNFRLTYLGDAIPALKDTLAEKIALAQTCIDEADMGWFNKTELESAIAAGKTVEETFDALSEAINALDAAINNYNAIVERYKPLKDKIAEAVAALDTHPCAEILQAAIDEAQAVYDNPAEQTAADIKAAIITLSVVDVDCYIAGLETQPSSTAPADLTQFLANPDFEELQGDRQQTIPGWTKEGTANSEFCTRNDAGPGGTFKSGNVYFQYWSTSRPDYSISQEVLLPNGFYKVTAAAGGNDGTTGTFVFANNVQVEVGATKDYSVVVEVKDNILVVGFKSVNRTVDWSFADNFRLYYYGLEAPAAPAMEVDKAKLNFFHFSKEQTFVVKGTNLSGPVTLTPLTGIALSKTSITAAEVQAEGGATVTATFTGTSAFTGRSIAISAESGAISKSITVNAFLLTDDNLVQYWSGLGAEAAGTRPNDVGWSNTTGNTIPWSDANSSSGCRFRDNTAGITYESDESPFTGRHLMLRWDGASYYSSVYAYPVVLEAATKYKFDFDVFLGGSASSAGSINIGISTTPDDAGRLSSQDAAYTLGSKVNVAPTYKFTSEAAGLYYITFKGNNFVTPSYQPWIGVANLMLVKDTEVSIETPLLSGKLFVYPTVTSDVLNVNKPEGTRVFIFDLAGNKVMETTLSTNTLNVGFLQSGVYLVGTANGERAKFIKK